MASTGISINQNSVMKNAEITITITGEYEARVRRWIAVRLFKLGARVLGTKRFQVKLELGNK